MQKHYPNSSTLPTHHRPIIFIMDDITWALTVLANYDLMVVEWLLSHLLLLCWLNQTPSNLWEDLPQERGSCGRTVAVEKIFQVYNLKYQVWNVNASDRVNTD